MIRLADYVAQVLAERGVRHVFMVTGGGAMHLNDAFGRCKALRCVCCHHEQACAMAAESYNRLSRKLAAVNVTTGPGGTNAITGVYGAYVDSLAMIVVSGQVKMETLVRSTGLPLRQLGDQEIDITTIIAPITKYAVIVTDAKTIRYHLEKALYLAEHGRPGPVWVDIPIDLQGAQIDPDALESYTPEPDATESPAVDLRDVARQAIDRMRSAKRPVIMAGSGIRLGRAHGDFVRLVDAWKIPTVTAWNAHDALWNDHPCYVGRPGTVGDRAGNFCVQNADFLLVLGCRLNIRQVSYDWKSFARAAFKVIVDIDAFELKKPTIRPDLPVHADVADFLRELLRLGHSESSPEHREWLDWCLERRRRYPAVLPEYWGLRDSVNPYCFVDTLFRELLEDEIVVTGDGTACVVTFQAANIKRGQRLYTNSGCAAMGYDLPAAIGAYHATGARRIVCLAGDGSIQMNLQELQTIVTQRIPLKLFVLNNRGYHSIRQTQSNYFPDNIVGCGEESGLGFPDFEKLAHAYGIAYRRCPSHDQLENSIRETLQGDGARMCEVILDLSQGFAPKVSSRKLSDGRMISSPLEDMAPFLPRDEFRSNMFIPPLESSVHRSHTNRS